VAAWTCSMIRGERRPTASPPSTPPCAEKRAGSGRTVERTRKAASRDCGTGGSSPCPEPPPHYRATGPGPGTRWWSTSDLEAAGPRGIFVTRTSSPSTFSTLTGGLMSCTCGQICAACRCATPRSTWRFMQLRFITRRFQTRSARRRACFVRAAWSLRSTAPSTATAAHKRRRRADPRPTTRSQDSPSWPLTTTRSMLEPYARRWRARASRCCGWR